MANSVSTLRDNFTDNTIAATWSTSVSGSATAAETGGQARLTLPSSTAGSHVASWRSTGAYDLTAGSFYWNIETMVSTSVAATALMDLRLSDNLNVLRWTQTSGTLKAQTIVAGVATDRYSVAWNATTYKYLRIRESGGNVLFDSSSNGTTWTNRASVAAPFAVTELLITFAVSGGNIASPGSLRLDDVNIILPALTTNWHWTQAEWPILYRFRTVTISASSGQGYIATSSDGTTWQYFSGPMGSASGGYNALTLHSTQAAAEAMAVNLPGPANPRWDLPDITECRFIRLYHRSTTGASYDLYEHYPRRLVQSDDIEAESIRAINIAANSITADKITTLTLTGKSIQTASSGARVELSGHDFGGLIGYNTTDTYNPSDGTGTYQVLWDKADGELYAGTGTVVLGSDGIRIVDPGTFNDTAAYKFTDAGGATVYGGLYGHNNLGAPRITLQTAELGVGTLIINARSGAGSSAFATLQAAEDGGDTVKVECRTGSVDQITMMGSGPTTTLVDIIAMLDVAGGVNIGAATSAITGQVAATIANADTTARAYPLILNHSSSGTPGALFGTGIQMLGESSTTADQPLAYIEARWASATHASRRSELTFLLFDAASFRVPFTMGSTGSASAVGFHGSAAIAKPTVTGSRGGNAALQSLLSALASYGLITDSSS
jgi:hypothetical protein